MKVKRTITFVIIIIIILVACAPYVPKPQDYAEANFIQAQSALNVAVTNAALENSNQLAMAKIKADEKEAEARAEAIRIESQARIDAKGQSGNVLMTIAAFLCLAAVVIAWIYKPNTKYLPGENFVVIVTPGGRYIARDSDGNSRVLSWNNPRDIEILESIQK